MSTKWVDAFDKSKKVKKDKLPKKRYSNWFIIIVSDQKDSPEVRKSFVNIVTQIYDHQRIKPYIDGDVGTILPGEKGVQIVGAFEIAPKTQYAHAHMIIKIQHHGKILLSYERMRAALNEAMGFNGHDKPIHFNPKPFHDTATTNRLRDQVWKVEEWGLWSFWVCRRGLKKLAS